MKPMTRFRDDRGLSIYVDPQEVSTVEDDNGGVLIALKNGTRVRIKQIFATDVMAAFAATV